MLLVFRGVVEEVSPNRTEALKALAVRVQIEPVPNVLLLLDLALTHPTYAFENGLSEHNQRLEFLGDAVLNLVVAEQLYREFPDASEGELTQMRAALVCEASLAEAAGKLGLGEFLLLGRGEERAGGRYRRSNLADALEAVAGALYLAGGLPAVWRLAEGVLGTGLKEKKSLTLIDAKTRLQELVQGKKRENVSYRVLGEWGPDHDKCFRVGVFYRGKLLATGEGRSKKEAEQEAARVALERVECGDLRLV
ncbi:RNAse III [Thermanaeromonas toyohensis ToBE]|uniref:Ribonuclease 3 n=1 Tax=Thermanaeromonas toyohensis ToBE TaxID=698762 RepID=A0A1W1VSJ6_9FIRM|nr:ribonuclease III [Thermanaeromonas toyohensis]SMB96328.1 RNAse III [Thermanaeromonas toyohensis ToBE]